MPFLRINILTGWASDEVSLLGRIVHKAVVKAFEVPERDLYQIITEHEARNLQAQDTGLGFARTERFVLIDVTSRPRTREQKMQFYKLIANELEEMLAIDGSDLMICFTANTDEDWSFGYGRAQFLTGEL